MVKGGLGFVDTRPSRFQLSSSPPPISAPTYLPAMDLGELKSASNYVNNQLAARGLLRGLPIDFAKPAKEVETPARIINLVHELVKRRDVGLLICGRVGV